MAAAADIYTAEIHGQHLPSHVNEASVAVGDSSKGPGSPNSNGTRVRYHVNTAAGWSGNSMLQRQGRLVALHPMRRPELLALPSADLLRGNPGLLDALRPVMGVVTLDAAPTTVDPLATGEIIEAYGSTLVPFPNAA